MMFAVHVALNLNTTLITHLKVDADGHVNRADMYH